MTIPHKNTKSSAPSAAKKLNKKIIKAEGTTLELPIFSMEGKKVGSIALPEKVFGQPWRSDLVHQVTTAIQANLRQNRANTKDRSEVAGGGKKPWKQKGTGQARHGSTRSPIWRHGGITFGPRAERDYSEKINRKMRTAALFSALSHKAKDGEIILIDSLAFTAPKTSVAKVMLGAIAKETGATDLIYKKKNAALIALGGYDINAIKSFRNFGNIQTEELRNLNPLSVLSAKYLIIEKPQEAFDSLTKRAKSGSTSSRQAK